MTIQVQLELSQEVEEQARQLGLLTPENLSELVVQAVREKQRDWAIRSTREILAQLDALQPSLTQAEIDAILRGK